MIIDPWTVSAGGVHAPLQSYYQLWIQDLAIHIKIKGLGLILFVSVCPICLAFG